jgi:predicted SpoU family rRNA methylase
MSQHFYTTANGTRLPIDNATTALIDCIEESTRQILVALQDLRGTSVTGEEVEATASEFDTTSFNFHIMTKPGNEQSALTAFIDSLQRTTQ